MAAGMGAVYPKLAKTAVANQTAVKQRQTKKDAVILFPGRFYHRYCRPR